MSKSDNLRKAKSNKNDEYYTLIEDIEKEILLHEDYVRQFEGKTVYCNCDNPEWSNFYKFFKIYFHQLKLKKLITTHFNSDGSSYKIEWSGEMLNDDMLNLIKTPLKGNGDFNSDECIEILKESDIIVTNPPFSIARELFIPLLQKYNKKFIIIGDLNWVAYKYVFPLFKDNKIHFGYTNVKEFCTPEGTMTKFGNKTWFTNFDIEKTHKPLILTKTYYGNEEDYPKYDNYDAIECSKVKDIPKDYFPCWYKCPHSSSCIYGQTEGKEDNALCEQACNGEIGVPITYMSNHCNEQFAILGSDNDFANNMKDIAEEGTYEKGGPAFYISKKKDRFYLSPKTLQQTCHSQNAVSVMESSECQSHSSLNSVPNNSELSVLETESVDKKSESEVFQKKLNDKWLDTPQPVTCMSLSTENLKFHTIESLFKDCKKCNGLIGVPITFLNDYCCDQFSIKGYSEAGNNDCTKFYKKMHLCQPLNGGDKPNNKSARYAPMLPFKPNNNENYYTADNAIYKMKKVYTRIFIQRKPMKE